MKKTKIYLAFVLAVIFAGCSSDDNSAAAEKPVVINFEVSVSAGNGLRVIADNKSTGASGFEAYWQFTEGGEKVLDGPGPEYYLYDGPGEYQVTLTIEAPAKTYTDTKNITIDGEAGPDPQAKKALKEAATTFSVGMIVQANRLGGKHDEVISKDFNSITSEYEMKMNIMYPSEGNYNFDAADAIVDFAVSRGMDVHGHALIWHNATPSWVENFSGTDAEFEAMVEDYITTTVTRYKGKVRSWDVVNEAIEDGSNNLRNSVFKQKMGDDFIAKCFQFAKNADPDVLLFYNDYNLTFDSGKQNAMFAIVDDLKSQGLIDGVGAQMHISYNGPSSTQIQSVVDGTVSRDLLMHFSELDIRANPDNDLTTALTDSRAIEQQAKYKEVVEIYNAIPQDSKFALTVWGLRDNESWLLDFWGNPDWPLLYDSAFNTKKAHDGFLEGLE